MLNQEPEYFSPANYTSGQEYKRNYLMLKKFLKAKLQNMSKATYFSWQVPIALKKIKICLKQALPYGNHMGDFDSL